MDVFLWSQNRKNRMQTVEKIYTIIKYKFKNKEFLFQALHHPSIRPNKNFQRLEFLGDRILNFVISEKLYKEFPKLGEGKLSMILSQQINKETVAKVAKKIELHKFLIYQKENLNRHNEGILCDAMESLIGAIYIDAKNYNTAKQIILKLWSDIDTKINNPKTYLQELLQSKKLSIPKYELIETLGSNHNPKFKIQLKINEKIFISFGSSKKSAEKKIAIQAISYLKSILK